MFERATDMKIKLDKLRPLPSYTFKSIRDKMLLDWIYNSNAMEGNTLSLVETKVVLEGIAIGGKKLNEHLEVVNHRDAIVFVEDIVQNKEEISEDQIKKIHELIIKGIDTKNAGVYREDKNLDLNEEMAKFIEWYKSEEVKEMHPIERAARVNGEFDKMRPFIDGNSRVARLLLNLELMKEGYPPIIIMDIKKVYYYEALDKAHIHGDYKDMIAMVQKEVINSLDLYLRMINK